MPRASRFQRRLVVGRQSRPSSQFSDGAEALKEIKAFGGITIAQTPEESEWSDMPESAIKTGYVDYVLSIEAIAQKITQIANELGDK